MTSGNRLHRQDPRERKAKRSLLKAHKTSVDTSRAKRSIHHRKPAINAIKPTATAAQADDEAEARMETPALIPPLLLLPNSWFPPDCPFPVCTAPTSTVADPTFKTDVANVAVGAVSSEVDAARASSVRKTMAMEGALSWIGQVLVPASHSTVTVSRSP